MKKICIFTLYGERGASSNFRLYQYRQSIDSIFDARWYSFWSDQYVKKYIYNKKQYAILIFMTYVVACIRRMLQIILIANKVDVVLFQKSCIPKQGAYWIKYLKNRGVKIIFDVDDAIFTVKGDHSDEIVQYSDKIICGNKFLEEHYKQINVSCEIIPTTDDTCKYEKFYSNTYENKIIGWIGTENTAKNLAVIVNPINKIMDKYQNVTFVIISNSALDYPNKIKRCKLIQWGKDTYLEDLSKITLGIMPLVDKKLNDGKCAFKLIQYLSMRKPVIASDIGVNKKVVSNYGFIANSEDEWERALEQLLFDEDTYNTMVENIDKDFLEKYHYNLVCDRLIKVIDEVMDEENR